MKVCVREQISPRPPSAIGTAPGCAPAVVALAFSVCLPEGTEGADQSEGDAITNVIEQEFWRDDVVPFNRVDVATADGFVTLTGNVTTLAARHYAEERASLVRGVRGIVNRIDVVAREVPAGALEQAVTAALAADPATDEYDVEVAADDGGKVTLTGTVESHAERALVSTVTTTVPGVSAIDNRLEVHAPRAAMARPRSSPITCADDFTGTRESTTR